MSLLSKLKRRPAVSPAEPSLDEKPFRLAKSFSLIAIVMIFASVLTLAAVVSRQAEVIITKRVEDDTLKLIENLNHQMYENFLKKVADPYTYRTRLRDPEQQQLLNEVITNTIYGFDLNRVIIYSKEGEVVYATDQTRLTSPAEDIESFNEAVAIFSPLRKVIHLDIYRRYWQNKMQAEPPWPGFSPSLPKPEAIPRPRPDQPNNDQAEAVPPGGGSIVFFNLWLKESPDQRELGELGELGLNGYSQALQPPEEAPPEVPLEVPPAPEPLPEAQAPDEALPSPETVQGEDDYMNKIRAQTVFRYEGGTYFFSSFFPRGNFVLRSYKAMEDYTTLDISGVLELDRDLTPEYRQIARLQYFALSVAFFLALGLTIILNWVVSRGEAIITKRNQERQALREQLDQAERLAGLGSMVATVAHEIRNPLGIIHSTADVLNRFLAENPDQARLARAIVEEANRLSQVVTEFLDFARPPTPRLEPMVVEEMLEEILAFLEVTLTRAGIEVRTDFREDQSPVPGDASMLHRAFLNILVNAIQAMDDGGLICIGTRLEPDGQKRNRLLVSISDTGPGLTEEAAKKLFSPFYTTKAKGTGLGLVIVRNIIEGHGGEIELKNGPPAQPGDDCGPGLVVNIRLKM